MAAAMKNVKKSAFTSCNSGFAQAKLCAGPEPERLDNVSANA
jgi:hypothetical protein